MYGHFGHGCVHLRINFDFKSANGIAAYREFIDRATDLVVSLGGSISGEHGDGQARGVLLEKMFGAELIEAFREFKRLWDPENRMNPGKLIDAYQPQDFLRINPSHPAMETTTHFHFASDGGSFEHAALRCVGVGACRKDEAGTMCPSYMATKEEQHSTRGRAHLLWEMMQGDVIKDGWRCECTCGLAAYRQADEVVAAHSPSPHLAGVLTQDLPRSGEGAEAARAAEGRRAAVGGYVQQLSACEDRG
jgi:hypothetical protein